MVRSGVRFQEQMVGWLSVVPNGGPDTGRAWFRLRGEVIIEDLDEFIVDARHRGVLVGYVDFDPLGKEIPASGHVELFAAGANVGARVMRYRATFNARGFVHEVIGTKYVNKSEGYNVWGQTTTLFTTIVRNGPEGNSATSAGVIKLSVWQGLRLLLTLRGTGQGGFQERAGAALKFIAFFVQQVTKCFLPVVRAS